MGQLTFANKSQDKSTSNVRGYSSTGSGTSSNSTRSDRTTSDANKSSTSGSADFSQHNGDSSASNVQDTSGPTSKEFRDEYTREKNVSGGKETYSYSHVVTVTETPRQGQAPVHREDRTLDIHEDKPWQDPTDPANSSHYTLDQHDTTKYTNSGDHESINTTGSLKIDMGGQGHDPDEWVFDTSSNTQGWDYTPYHSAHDHLDFDYHANGSSYEEHSTYSSSHKLDAQGHAQDGTFSASNSSDSQTYDYYWDDDERPTSNNGTGLSYAYASIDTYSSQTGNKRAVTEGGNYHDDARGKRHTDNGRFDETQSSYHDQWLYSEYYWDEFDFSGSEPTYENGVQYILDNERHASSDISTHGSYGDWGRDETTTTSSRERGTQASEHHQYGYSSNIHVVNGPTDFGDGTDSDPPESSSDKIPAGGGGWSFNPILAQQLSGPVPGQSYEPDPTGIDFDAIQDRLDQQQAEQLADEGNESPFWEGTKAFFGTLWDGAKKWDYSEIQTSYWQLRDSGHDGLSSFFIAAVNNVEEHSALHWASDAMLGQTADGANLSLLQRAWRLPAGLGLSAIEILGLRDIAPPALKSLNKGLDDFGQFVRGLFPTARPSSTVVGVPSKLTNFTRAEEAMIRNAEKALADAGYDISKLKEIVKADGMPAGTKGMSLTDGAALGDEAFSSQQMLNHVLEEELIHSYQKGAGKMGEAGVGGYSTLEEEVNEIRKFLAPTE